MPRLALPVLLGLLCTLSVKGADEAKLVEVESRGLKLRVPASWKRVETDSKFRAAQFDIPAKEAEGEAAELVVYHFGGPTGGIAANVNRWVEQFHEAGRSVTLVQGQSAQGKYVLADIAGTWKKPDGPPFARKTIDTPHSRVIGVVLIATVEDKPDYFFFKLGGPDALVPSTAQALRTAYGADAAQEKPYDLNEK